MHRAVQGGPQASRKADGGIEGWKKQVVSQQHRALARAICRRTREPNPNDSYASAAAPEGMSALVDAQRAAGAEDAVASLGELNDDNNFPSAPSDDDTQPLSPATDYDDENEDPVSPCASDNGLLASSEGEIRVGPSIARPTAVEPTTTPPPPPVLTDLDAPTCVICLELCGNQPARRVHSAMTRPTWLG